MGAARLPVRGDAPVNLETADLATIGILVVLEGLLSADNALVMAVMVLGLPAREHQKALRYGLIGAFAFRIVATLLATYLIKVVIVKLLGGLYLGYLALGHFRKRGGADDGHGGPRAQGFMGLSAFWATVVRVEAMNLAFSIDSILVAVAMSPKFEVVLAGGLLGIVAMRLVVGRLLALIQRYPALVDGAFVIIAWVAFKLVADYVEEMHWTTLKVPQSISIGVIVVIFVASYVIARRQTPRDLDAGPTAP